MTQDRELRQEDLDVPEYAAARGARLEGILGRVSDAPLRDGNSIQLLKNGTLKTYKGFPHGMPTTEATTINADLLAFIKG